MDKVIVLWTANTERFADLVPGLNDTAENLMRSIKSDASEIAPSTLFAVASILEEVRIPSYTVLINSPLALIDFSFPSAHLLMDRLKTHLYPVALKWPRKPTFSSVVTTSSRVKRSSSRCWWIFWLALDLNPYPLLAIIIWATTMAKTSQLHNNSAPKRFVIHLVSLFTFESRNNDSFLSDFQE